MIFYLLLRPVAGRSLGYQCQERGSWIGSFTARRSVRPWQRFFSEPDWPDPLQLLSKEVADSTRKSKKCIIVRLLIPPCELSEKSASTVSVCITATSQGNPKHPLCDP